MDAPLAILHVRLRHFFTLDSSAAAEMQQIIERCAAESDSVGGVLETAVCGLDAGIGEPIFDTIEGEIAKAMLADGMEISKVAKLTNLSVKEVTALA